MQMIANQKESPAAGNILHFAIKRLIRILSNAK